MAEGNGVGLLYIQIRKTQYNGTVCSVQKMRLLLLTSIMTDKYYKLAKTDPFYFADYTRTRIHNDWLAGVMDYTEPTG